VPGTHDPALGIAIIDGLRKLDGGETLRLPRFEKARDDRMPEERWPVIEGPVDAVLFEGWCVGSRPVAEETLDTPVNELEQQADPDGVWRRFVNAQLAGDYQELFRLLDALVYLAVPGFDCVRRWRTEQEHQLLAGAHAGAGQVMSDAEIAAFVLYFERITRQDLNDMPTRADVVLRLGRDHGVFAANYRPA
jgi:D-glycerate 3-kinase